MTKLYYAYVDRDAINIFEDELAKRNDEIKVISTSPAISENGKPLTYYVLEAEEGLINSKWELKQ